MLFFLLLLLFKYVDLRGEGSVKCLIGFSLIILYCSWVYSFLQLNFIPLQTRPDFLGSSFYRVRLFFTEPSYLGYWSALFLLLSYINKLKFATLSFTFFLIISSSTGAFAFFALLTFFYIFDKKEVPKLKVLGFLSVAIFCFLYFNLEQIQSKISLESLSLLHRLDNFNFVLNYVIDSFPYPKGFGPIDNNGTPVGILNFNILLIKGLGVFALLLFFDLCKTPFVIPAYLLLSTMVGAFWEVPLLFLMFNSAVFNLKNGSH